MGIWGDIAEVWARFSDARESRPSHTMFTHTLPEFPLPRRVGLPDPLPEVVIATPCKNAARFLDSYFALVDALDYPRDRLHLHVLEGDSGDGTHEAARAALDERSGTYAGTRLLKHDTGFDAGAGNRARWEIQLQRRSAIAACRNRLLASAMETGAGYVLFIDVDMAMIPANALKLSLSYAAPILVANCLQYAEDEIFDRNAFFYTRRVSDRSARRYVKGGLYQPPRGYFRHYPDFRTPNEIEPLHAVGGTFLLIRRDVVEAGADFPEKPYQLHIETEGFALKAADLGFGAFMAPGLIVRHGPD